MNEEKKSVGWILIVVLLLTAILATGVLVYYFTIQRLGCGKSPGSSMFVINTAELPTATIDFRYSTNITATFIGVHTELTADLPEIPEITFGECTTSFDSDLAPSPNTAIYCPLDGFVSALDEKGTPYEVTFNAPKLGESLTKTFVLKTKYLE